MRFAVLLAATTAVSSFGTPQKSLFGVRKSPLGSTATTEWRQYLEADTAQSHIDCEALESQLESLDKSYPGGLPLYLSKAKKLLQESAEGVNPFTDFTAKIPQGLRLESFSSDFNEMERLGLSKARGLCVCLVAGGLGERLGYSGIKLSLDTNLAHPLSYLEHYILYIKALQKKLDTTIPLVIMTSGDTDGPTRDLLARNKNFDCDIEIVMQEKVPALRDGQAGLSLDSDGGIETKPHGHGDVHSLLHQHGIVDDWLKKGKTHVVFLQDTNGLAVHGVLATLGVSIQENMAMNSVCIPRLAGEAAGAITRLEHQTDPSKSLVINVEYNQLDPLLQTQGAGDVADPDTGYSPYPGNANNFILELKAYNKVLQGEDQGVVLEFVNPKYADDTRTLFTKPTRLECMMQDIPKLYQKEVPDAKIGFTSLDRWLVFSPAKNALAAGASTLSTAESDDYLQNQRKLKNLGCSLPEESMTTLAGVEVTSGPRIWWGPSFAASHDDLVQAFPEPSLIQLSTKSSLVLMGSVRLESLDLDGALEIIVESDDAEVTVKGSIANMGWEWKELDDGDDYPEEVAIRGYTKVEHETARFIINEPGKYVIEDGLLRKV